MTFNDEYGLIINQGSVADLSEMFVAHFLKPRETSIAELASLDADFSATPCSIAM